ncbi:glycosyl transferase [Candidatus Methylomirabilis lanthanidiphila]|uniref:Glycosyl transferase n=1 Tax=Candidatus Methylomirabilis lanthanidiphila TaxID=2211376 RepID=A0A564ZKC4_9BACT|nr:TIGR04283 family arsenosugar biosynthesis glycosyltransferase [Candidatus Methylomirabilis lanthanidiphila]VUZ85008.1 glycosyl transferase [Candidatus Methylomirabilis lanthanidiphila]
MLSVIIPVLNEAENLERLLPHLCVTCPEAEVIVVDGGSEDKTSAVVRRFPRVRLLSSERGRARQMNAGAKVANGECLLFLHADTLLPAGAEAAILEAVSSPDIVAGRFDVRFDNLRPVFKVIAFFINLRSRVTKICTGDQALFVRRRTFEELGGYPDIPLMEDVEFAKRLKRKGAMSCLRLKVTTSARKWEQGGVLRVVLLMWMLRFCYFVGVRPEQVHRWYYPSLASPDRGESEAMRAELSTPDVKRG